MFFPHDSGGVFFSQCSRRGVFCVGFFFSMRLVGFFSHSVGGWVSSPTHAAAVFLFFPSRRVVFYFPHAAGGFLFFPHDSGGFFGCFFFPMSPVRAFFSTRGGWWVVFPQGWGFLFSSHGGWVVFLPMRPEGRFLAGFFFFYPRSGCVFFLFSRHGGWFFVFSSRGGWVVFFPMWPEGGFLGGFW